MKSIHDTAIDSLPLNATKAFEVFARLGSVNEAAKALGITSSAVSHRLSQLEDFLGISLTARRGRGLVLTDEGREFLDAVLPAFFLLRAASNQIRFKARPHELTVSAIPLFSVGWLIPRLQDFRAQNPDINLRLSHANNRNYLSDAADVSIRFGSGGWPGYTSEFFLSGGVVPVASPLLVPDPAAIRRNPGLLATLPLIHDENTNHWLAWFQQQGVDIGAEIGFGPMFEDGLLTRVAAIAGVGVALSRPGLIAEDIRAGHLVTLSDQSADDGRNYHLCVRSDGATSLIVTRFLRWIRKFKADESVTPSIAPNYSR